MIAQTTLVRPNHQISENTRQAILLKLTEDRTIENIAQEFNVSPVSVNRIMGELKDDLKPHYDQLPTVLCFDELRSIGHQMSFIASNGQTHEPILMLPTRFNKDIYQYFINHYSLSSREEVTHVVVDFNAQYQSVIRQLFPNAQIVADNFHLVQMAQRALNQSRVQLMKHYNVDSSEYRLLKFHWRLFLMNYDRLEKNKPQWFPHLHDHLTQEAVVARGLNLDETFANTYRIAHEIIESCQKRNWNQFAQALSETATVNPLLKTVTNTFKKQRKPIQNMMSCTYSNGPLEGVNREIKQIKRTAYGYRNWNHFRLRIQIQFKIKIKKRRPIRK